MGICQMLLLQLRFEIYSIWNDITYISMWSDLFTYSDWSNDQSLLVLVTDIIAISNVCNCVAVTLGHLLGGEPHLTAEMFYNELGLSEEAVNLLLQARVNVSKVICFIQCN